MNLYANITFEEMFNPHLIEKMDAVFDKPGATDKDSYIIQNVNTLKIATDIVTCLFIADGKTKEEIDQVNEFERLIQIF